MSEKELTREQLVEDLSFLSETAMEFLRLGSEQNIYKYVADRLRYIVGDSWTVIASYHPERDAVRLRAVSGFGPLQTRIFKMIGENPIGRYRKINEKARPSLFSGRLHKVPLGIYDVLFQKIPLSVARAVEKLGNIDEIYSMGCVSRSTLLGTALIAVRNGTRIRRSAVIEAFMNQSAVAIQRAQAEEQTHRSEVRYGVLMDQILDLVIVVDKDLNIEEVNRRAVEKLGYTHDFLIGRNLTEILDPEELAGNPVRWDLIRMGRRFATKRRVRCADGRYRVYAGTHNPLDDGRALIIATDVSGERERSEMPASVP